MKKQIKKLNINKMTITNLDASEMNKQVGGQKSNACVFTKKCRPSW